jgi:integrase
VFAVFTQSNGKPLHPNLVTRSFVRLTKRLGLPRITIHDVRHSAIVRMLYLGVPVKTVSEIAGHASAAFTLDRYGHAIPAMRKDAAAIIGAGV